MRFCWLSGSWEKLPEVYVPLLRYPSQDVGYMVLDMSTDAKPDKHMLAFESLKDAQMAKRVYQKFVRAVMHVIPMNPNQLKQIVKAERLSTTVYKPGQLRVETGMTQQEFSQAAHLAGPGFESLQEELLSQ